MSSINTGPTATTVHHLLAALQAWTGLEPIWLLMLLVFVGAFLATATCAVVERAFRDPEQYGAAAPRKGGSR